MCPGTMLEYNLHMDMGNTENVVVNVHGCRGVYLEVDLQFNGHCLGQLFILLLGHHIWYRQTWLVICQNAWNAAVVR